jgi:hypothetical protein
MSSWRHTIPIARETARTMGEKVGVPRSDQNWAELLSPTRLATAPSVAKGAALVFPRDCGSLQSSGRNWMAALGRVSALIGARLAVAATAGLLLLSSTSAHAADLVRSGTITIEQVQVAFIGSGNLGGGTLTVGGTRYNFSIGGLGIGGFGVSKMECTGTVYNLKNLNDFPGGYVQARYGMAVGQSGGGQLWLENTKGVVIEVKAKRSGLALSLGGDAVYINFD